MPSLIRAALGVLALVLAGAAAPPAAFPNRHLSVVAVALDGAPWGGETAVRVARHAEHRLGLLPDKVHVVDVPPNRAEFETLFRQGRPFQRVSSDDLLIVYLVGPPERRRGVPLADGLLPWRHLARLPTWLREGSGGAGSDLGHFDGTVLLVVDGPGEMPAAALKGSRGLAVLNLVPRSPSAGAALDVGASPPAERDALLGIGLGALAVDADDKGAVSPSAALWAGGLESLLAAGEGSGADLDAVAALLGAARRGTGIAVTHRVGRGHDPARFRLFRRKLRITLFPGAGAVPPAMALLERIEERLRAALPEYLVPVVEIEQRPVEDPTADILCDGDADAAGRAEVECYEGDVTLYASGEFEVEHSRQPLDDLAAQVLNDYPRLVARNWSSQRRDLRPLDLVVAIDTSVSMAYHDPTPATDPSLPPHAPSKREVVLLRIASTLSGHAERTGLPARLTVLMFGSEVRPLALPGGEVSVTFRKRLSSDLLLAYASVFRNGARSEPYTGIAAVLARAASILRTGNEGADRHVVLLTDGRETVAVEDPRAAVRTAAGAVLDAGATLHTIGLSEQDGRLEGYLQRMRDGGDVLRRYVGLLDMRFAEPACRVPAGWTPETASRCGAFFADHIERGGGYEPGVLETLRRSGRAGVPDGLFLHADSMPGFQRRLAELVARLTGRGIYAIRGGSRRRDPKIANRVADTWHFDLDLRTDAQLVIYSRDALQDVKWAVTRDGEPVDDRSGVFIVDETTAVTRIHLPSPARGIWTVVREGRLR